MQFVVYVIKRVLLVAIGYCLALLTALVTAIIAYFILIEIPGVPTYFTGLALSPLVFLAAPATLLLVLIVSVMFTGPPSVVLGLLGEIFSLRALWLYAPVGAVIGVGAYAYGTTFLVDGIDQSDWVDLGVVALAGGVGGVVYWMFAGRNAGFRRLGA